MTDNELITVLTVELPIFTAVVFAITLAPTETELLNIESLVAIDTEFICVLTVELPREIVDALIKFKKLFPVTVILTKLPRTNVPVIETLELMLTETQ